jgi:ribonuclease P/MRP protein subunit POP3
VVKRRTTPITVQPPLTDTVMTDKNARTVSQPSNRAKAKDVQETKTVFKAVLDNPHRIHWCVSICLLCEFSLIIKLRPSVPLNVQNAILAKILQLLDGTSEYKLQRSTASRKRKSKEKSLESKKQKLELDKSSQSRTIDRMDEDSPQVDSDHSQVDMVIEPPTLFRYLVYGMNEVTVRLEIQTQAVRRPVVVRLPEQPEEDTLPALGSIFVCRSDMNPTLPLDHLPHLVAAYNSSRPPSFITLVPLPKGAELSLAQALGVRRVSVFGIEVSAF